MQCTVTVVAHPCCIKAEGGQVEGGQSPDRPENKTKKRQRRERKHDILSWLVLVQLLILVYISKVSCLLKNS